MTHRVRVVTTLGCTSGHRLDPVRASVSVLPRDGGGPLPVEFDAWWCPKCINEIFVLETIPPPARGGPRVGFR